MMENQSGQKIKVVEMAKKRRHIALLEKMQRGKSSTPALSKTEIKELEQLEQDPNSPGIVDSQEKVARVMGVSDRTVRHWIKDGMPVTPQGKYDLLEIRAWRTLRNERNRKGSTGKKSDLDAWDAKFREYKARLAEIKLKQTLGALIPREIVERELIQISLSVKRNLLALPNQLAAALVGLDARQISVLLTCRIKEIIVPFSDGKIFTASKTKNQRKNAEIIDSNTLD